MISFSLQLMQSYVVTAKISPLGPNMTITKNGKLSSRKALSLLASGLNSTCRAQIGAYAQSGISAETFLLQILFTQSFGSAILGIR
jgi:hypothetical protein